MANKFHATASGHWEGLGERSFVVDGYFIQQYLGSGSSCVIEGRLPGGELWPTKADAEVAAARADAGDCSGMKMAQFADD